MISVIILTKNLKYAVLDVPASGKLQIKEMHLICGMVQNGVKVFPYGSVLSAFETFIQNENLSVGIIPHSEFQQEGRVLDFTVIELLQLSTSIPLSSSGSSVPFVPPIYYELDLPVNYNLTIGGYNWQNYSEVQTAFTGQLYKVDIDAICNGVTTLADGTQKLSMHNTDKLNYYGAASLPDLTAFLDYEGIFTSLYGGYFFRNNYELKSVVLNGLTHIENIWLNSTSLNYVRLAKLETIAVGAFNSIPSGFTLEVPRALETSNAGSPDPEIVYARDTKLATIVYLD